MAGLNVDVLESVFGDEMPGTRVASALCIAVAVGGGCPPMSQPIYVNCELIEAVGPKGPDSVEGIAWARSLKSFTGRFPTRWNTDGEFAGLDVKVLKASDMVVDGTMQYVNPLLRQPDGTFRLVPEKPELLNYRFSFNRLNNGLLLTYDEPVAAATTNVHLIRLACQRVKP